MEKSVSALETYMYFVQAYLSCATDWIEQEHLVCLVRKLESRSLQAKITGISL